MSDKPYLAIVSHYESCLEAHGDSHLGVDWPVADDVDTRHRVMLDLLTPLAPGERVRLLDFGCGAAHLYEYIRRAGIEGIDYSGLDLSERFVALAREKHPEVEFHCLDVLDDDVVLPRFDYVIMSGVFTEKRELAWDEMFEYFKRVVERVFEFVDRGLAFNAMSKHVDWEREDLFHLPFDELARFLTERVSRNFLMRSDYGLYEFTTYVYRAAMGGR